MKLVPNGPLWGSYRDAVIIVHINNLLILAQSPYTTRIDKILA